MGIYERDYYREPPRRYNPWTNLGQVCRWLIVLNVALFLLQVFTRNTGGAVPDVHRWGPVTEALWLDPPAVQRGEVWRLVTHAFVHHAGLPWHVLLTVLMLWWFGSDMERRYGSAEFLTFYLVCVLIGAAVFLLATMAGLKGRYYLGASAATVAVMLLAVFQEPAREVPLFGVVPVQRWLVALFLGGIDLLGLAGGDFSRAPDAPDVPARPDMMIAGLGEPMLSSAALYARVVAVGFAFAYYRFNWRLLGVLSIFGQRGPRKVRAARPARVAEGRDILPFPTSDTPPADDEHLEAKLDAVLAKVAKQGRESLTDSEQQILQQASELYKRKRT